MKFLDIFQTITMLNSVSKKFHCFVRDVKKLYKLWDVKNLKMIGKVIGKMIVDHDLI